jgi:hydrocephalus-inducing protein
VNAVYSKYSLAPLKNLNFGPMQYGENVTRSFEIRNEGLFEFKYAICDFNNEDEKNKIREERRKEAEDRLNGQKEEEVDPKLAAKGKKPDPKAAAPAKGGAKGKLESVPDG